MNGFGLVVERSLDIFLDYYGRSLFEKHKSLCRDFWETIANRCGVAFLPEPKTKLFIYESKYSISTWQSHNNQFHICIIYASEKQSPNKFNNYHSLPATPSVFNFMKLLLFSLILCRLFVAVRFIYFFLFSFSLSINVMFNIFSFDAFIRFPFQSGFVFPICAPEVFGFNLCWDERAVVCRLSRWTARKEKKKPSHTPPSGAYYEPKPRTMRRGNARIISKYKNKYERTIGKRCPHGWTKWQDQADDAPLGVQ